MAKTDFKSVDQYIASQPKGAQGVLRRLRNVIRKAVPATEEGIAYQIPAYKLHGTTVIFFAGWKDHYSLYPATPLVVATFKDDLAPYEVNNKGTIRFPLSKPLPVHLISRIAKLRAQEVADEKRKAPAPAKRAAKAKPPSPKKKAKAQGAKKRAATNANGTGQGRRTASAKRKAAGRVGAAARPRASSSGSSARASRRSRSG